MRILPNIVRSVLIVLLSIYAAGIGSTEAGILGPGQYNGIVVFDRWDGSILVNGNRVSYVSETIKELLRPYEGKSVQVDATAVFQPINPGDARIDELEILDSAVPNPNTGPYANLKLTIEAAFRPGDFPAFEVEIKNIGPEDEVFSLSGLAPTVLFQIDQISTLVSLPGDGPSYAVITRFELGSIQPDQWSGGGVSLRDAHGVPSFHYFRWMAKNIPQNLKRVRLKPGEGVQVLFVFDLPPGEYDFLVGLGSGFGPHNIASNLVAFDVFDDGSAITIEIDR
jgi:hypothetical protein